ncbi:MAG: hypothetical protein RLZZ253_76 [Verrucomicrobiota bacterium]|jgi:hypothetical protein
MNRGGMVRGAFLRNQACLLFGGRAAYTGVGGAASHAMGVLPGGSVLGRVRSDEMGVQDAED